MKKVSVIVATYRREEGLIKALDSLSKQTYEDFEIIIVDDNGVEEWNKKVKKIVDSFIQENPCLELKYIENAPNLGSAKTRNVGIDNACGKYVTFLDDDDIYLPNKIKRQVLYMEENGLEYSITDLFLYNDKNELISKRIRSYIKSFEHEEVFKYHLKYHLTGTDTMMFTKEYIQRIGGFSPIDVGDEYYLMEKAIENGGKFGYLSGCDVKAYIHAGQEEGLSSGKKKIEGENLLFKHKKQFFNIIDGKSRRYIKSRHYAVNAFAYLRSGKPFRFLLEGIKSFLSSPIACVKILKERN
jgi:glycosyltransferase involved in cell wall biosynthesis